MPSAFRQFCGIAGALFAPVLLVLAGLCAAGKNYNQSGFDVFLLFFGVAAGFACTFLFPMRWYSRVGLFLFYIPAQFWIVFLFGVSYVCGAYGNCL